MSRTFQADPVPRTKVEKIERLRTRLALTKHMDDNEAHAAIKHLTNCMKGILDLLAEDAHNG